MYAYVIRHPRPASAIRFESLTARFLTCADSLSGWQIIPTRIIILIKISHQITEKVCKNPHLYNLCLSHIYIIYAFRNTTALKLQRIHGWCFRTRCLRFMSVLHLFIVKFHCFKLINLLKLHTVKGTEKRAIEDKIKRYNDYQPAGLITFSISSPQHLSPAVLIEKNILVST